MKQHLRPISKNDEWLTPRWILDRLGEFDLDPAASINRPWHTAKQHYTIEDDGLELPWRGRVWLNPPFNRYLRPRWMQRMAEHGDGIMLIPANLETVAAREFVWGRCDGILFLDRRPHFCDISGRATTENCGCTICLVGYGTHNMEALIQSGLGAVVREVAA